MEKIPRRKIKACKHGTFEYFADDEFVGRSLDLYGEYSELEVGALAKILRSGDVVVEVGANIGALTIPMAKMVGPTGCIHALEPQPENYNLLANNIDVNDIGWITPYEVAASDCFGYDYMPKLSELKHKNYGNVELGKRGSAGVTVSKIDKLLPSSRGGKLDRLKLLKIDAQGHEIQVLRGACSTIEKFKPIIYCENDDPRYCQELVSKLVDYGYRCFWHRPTLWNHQNYFKNERNVFGGIVSINMLCVHEDSGIEVASLEEVADLRPGTNMYNREIARYHRILGKKPDDLDTRMKLAHYCSMMQYTEQARDLLEENLRRDPNHIASKHIRGHLELQAGNWREGFAAYELRYLQPNSRGFGARPHAAPKWDGEPTDQVVLLWAEQGFGDSIMFARFLKEAFRRAPNAIVEIQPQLYELFEMCRFIPLGRLHRLGRTMPSYDAHCSIPSLPYVLGLTTDRDMQSLHPAYLRADPAMVETWLAKSTPRIGICCTGSPRSERAYSRDIDPALTDSLARRYGPFLQLEQQGQFESFADTAACIASLDLVLTVDTSIAHLAGAMGIPTWLLLSFDPDWRWGLHSTSCVWYDSVRIFRQPRLADWEPVLAEVDAEFDKRIAYKAA